MPLKTRIIPVLLWDSRGLCKPISFQRPGRFVGSLMSAAMLYENRTCDELILLDIDATPNNRPLRFKDVAQFTSKLFCPLTIGGGVRTLEDIRGLLNAGADKVVIANVKIGQILFEQSCPVKQIDGSCVKIQRERATAARRTTPVSRQEFDLVTTAALSELR